MQQSINKMAKSSGCLLLVIATQLLLSIELVAANSADRDILLTPNRAQQQPGKTAYFRALSTFRQQRSNGDSAQLQRRKDTIPSLAKDDGIASKFIGAVVPWEEPLKHAIYLVLNNKVDDDDGDEAVANRRDDDGYGRTSPSYEQHTFDQTTEELAIQKAIYYRSLKHENAVRFGDIIPLARGRIERDARTGRYSIYEMDAQMCDRSIGCAINAEIPSNVSAVWTVEMVRHRNAAHGHASEFKLTVYPVVRHNTGGVDNRQTFVTDKRDARLQHQHGRRQIVSRTFVVRDIDYPKYFEDNALPSSPAAASTTTATTTVTTKATSPKTTTNKKNIERRTFDMLAGLAQTTFDDYRMPLHFGNYGLNENLNDEQLNIGEYFASGIHDVGPTAASYHPSTIKYGDNTNPTAFAPIPYHNGATTELEPHHLGGRVRFPTALEGINGPPTAPSLSGVTVLKNEFLDRISTTPLTATHLHHHYYMSPNGIRTDSKEKNVYDKYPGLAPAAAGNLQHLQLDNEPLHHVHPTISPNRGVTPTDFGIQPQHTLTEHPHFGLHPQQQLQLQQPIYPQTTYANLPQEQITPVQIAGTHQQHLPHHLHSDFGSIINQQHQQQFLGQQQLQIDSPPPTLLLQQQHQHQIASYYNQNEIPSTYYQATGSAGGYAPNNAYPVLSNIVHSRYNSAPASKPATTDAFRAHYQIVNDKYSEPDPLYHYQQIGGNVLQQHLNPHVLSHLYPAFEHIQQQQPQLQQHQHGLLPHLQQNTLDVVPLTAAGVPIGVAAADGQQSPGGTFAVLTTGKAGYDVPPEKLQLDPVGNNASTYGPRKPQTSGLTSEEQQQQQDTTGANDETGPSATTADGHDYFETSKNKERGSYPDSINAQLPPPNRDDDVTVPYVDSSLQVEHTSNEVADEPPPSRAPPKKNTTEQHRLGVVRLKSRKERTTTTSTTTTTTSRSTTIASPADTTLVPDTTATAATDKVKRGRYRSGQFQLKTTTEKPILKWMPKRTRSRVPNEFTSPAATAAGTSTSTTFTANTVVALEPATTGGNTAANNVTPTSSAFAGEEQTSISTSISVKVGNDRPVSNEVARLIYRGFLPTRLPNSSAAAKDDNNNGGKVDTLQLTRGNLSVIATNSSGLRLFRAEEATEHRKVNTYAEDQIARSILKHAQSV